MSLSDQTYSQLDLADAVILERCARELECCAETFRRMGIDVEHMAGTIENARLLASLIRRDYQ